MIKKGEFITLHYTGKLSDGTIFDTTDPEVAKRTGIDTKEGFRPVTIKVGEGMLVPGLDDALVGKTGTFSVTIQPEQAFGKKDAKLLQVIPTPQLNKQGIRPEIGMQLSVDGKYGIVKRTGGGRTTVDFNHPLASQEVTYDVHVLGTVTDLAQQVVAVLDAAGVPHQGASAAGNHITVKFATLPPKPLLDILEHRVKTLTSANPVSFEAGTK